MKGSIELTLPKAEVLRVSVITNLHTHIHTYVFMYTFLKKVASSSHLEPKAEGLMVRVSLVWESKVGFSMSALTNTQLQPTHESHQPSCHMPHTHRMAFDHVIEWHLTML